MTQDKDWQEMKKHIYTLKEWKLRKKKNEK